MALLFAGQARHRAIARVFGVPRDQEALVALILVLMLADAAHDKVTRLLAIPGAPSAGDGLLGAACVREVLGAVAGPSSRDTPMLGSLVTIAVLGGAVAPAVVKSIYGIRASSHRLSVGFHHRYGYLIDPGHWRQRRAERPT